MSTSHLELVTSPPAPIEPWITEPGHYPDVTADQYFADPVVGGSVSSSGARLLMKRAGPARLRYRLDHPGEDISEAFDFGIAAHHEVLGDNDDRIVVVNADSWRTNAAKDAAAAARTVGKTPILTKDYEKVQVMAEQIRLHPTAAKLLQAASGAPEQTLVWRDAHSKIMCRARVDWFRDPVEGRRLILVDYKTCKSADEEAFGKSSAEYGYHQQDDFYRRGAKAIGLDEDPAFLFVAQEKEPPYLVNVIELDQTAQIIGGNLNFIALNLYAECVESGQWPGFVGINEAQLPAYYRNRFDED